MKRALSRALLPLLLVGLAAAQSPPPLRFLHVSDSHLPMPASEEYLREVLADARSSGLAFAIHTGDITEFGGRRRVWPSYLALFEGSDLPHYPALGNHDQTWDGLADRLRERFGAPYYRFEHAGVVFFCLDSASYQDPRPSFGEGQLRWLAAELDALPPKARIALLLHHPLGSSELATPYEVQRLRAMLAGRQVLAVFVGHGHRAQAGRVGAFDQVMGGSTFGGQQGHGTCTIDADRIRYVYTFRDPQREPLVLLDAELGAFRPFALSLDVAGAGRGLQVRLTAGKGAPAFRGVDVAVDFADVAAASGRLGERLSVDTSDLLPGVHVVTATAAMRDGGEHCQLHEFEVEAPPTAALQPVWRIRLPEALQGPLAASGNVLACGSNAGILRGIALADGAELWRHDLGGPAPGGVAADGEGGFVAGALGGAVVRVDAAGRRVWRRDLEAPIAAAPLVVGDRVLVVDLDGRGHALDHATGETLWQREVAGYAVEKPPVALDDDRVVFGAWDTRVHAVALADGAPSWSLPARGARAAAARYYSPADCPPVVVDGKVFVADRKFELTVLDLDGVELGGEEDVASVAAYAPSHSVFLRRASGHVACLDSRTLALRWQRELPVGRTPTPLSADGEHVFAIGERDGVLYLLDAADGEILGRHRVNGGHYPFAPVALAGELAIVGGMDGRLTALRVARR